MKAPIPTEEEKDLVEEGDSPIICVEPGPNMRWFAQGFFMGLGFITATFIIWLILALVLAVALSG